jgi:hypothetical protein
MKKEFDKAIIHAKKCPYCGSKPEYVNSSEIYGEDYGMIYLCRNCDAYVGVHHGTSKRALGRLANKSLREAKKRAHYFFDQIWRRKIQEGIEELPKRKTGFAYKCWANKCRKLAYEWLGNQLGTPKEFTHIGMFDDETCAKVEELCKPYCRKKDYK